MPKKLTPEVIYTLDSLWKLEKLIIDTLDFREIIQNVVKHILKELQDFELNYKFVTLGLVEEREGLLRFVSCAKVDKTQDALINNKTIPLASTQNICIKTLNRKTPDFTYNMVDILATDQTDKNTQNKIEKSQKAWGVKTSILFPISVREKTVGLMIFGVAKDVLEISDLEKSLIQYFTNIVGIAVQNSRLYTNLEAETKQLVETNIRLRNLDKLKDEFISVTSHELRTPMTVIKSYLWLLDNEKGGKINEKQKRYIQKAIHGTERMLSLINDMLDVSRIEQMGEKFALEPVVLREIMEDITGEMNLKTKEKGLDLKWSIDRDIFKVMSNPNKLHEVLANLIGNAIKFTDKGKITIRAKTDEGGMALIEVTDTGRGVEKENLDKLFSKFGKVENTFRTVAEAGGTGLGLYIVKKLVEGMGGRVGVSSRGKGKGSTFWFTLKKCS